MAEYRMAKKKTKEHRGKDGGRISKKRCVSALHGTFEDMNKVTDRDGSGG